MEEEFNVSEKIDVFTNQGSMVFVKDIKEFIKRLKEELCGAIKPYNRNGMVRILDKLAGKKLI